MSDQSALLVTALQNELQCQQQLALLLENKLEAMRRYDVHRLEGLADSEKQLLEKMQLAAVRRRHTAETLTRQVLAQLGRPATAKELAAASDEPVRSQLYSLSALLAQECERVQRLNRINDIASRKMLGHVDQVFRVIAQAEHDVGLYSRGGRKPALEQNRIFDAIA